MPEVSEIKWAFENNNPKRVVELRLSEDKARALANVLMEGLTWVNWPEAEEELRGLFDALTAQP